uniref:Uncharacterized protein n=1 Tax=Rhizophora mucronata TaxID=61149 RepID=A0A2P2QD41_RHIMU
MEVLLFCPAKILWRVTFMFVLCF